MASYLTILLAIAVAIPAALGATCTECETTYTTTRDAGGATNAQKCTAAKEYGKCLLKASGAGCDTITTKVNTDVIAAMAALSSCTRTATCTCQLVKLAASVSTNDLKCSAAASYVACLYNHASSVVACDGTTTNNDYRTSARGMFSSYCTCSGHAIRFSLAMLLVVIAGMFFKS